MALARDLSDLPSPARTREGGRPPDTDPRFAHLLAVAWQAEDEAEGPRSLARQGARFRHSDAGKCARAVAYAALGVPPSNPMDLAGVFTVRLGTLVHEAWQAALVARYPDAEVEVKVGSGERAGHIDAVVRIPVLQPGTSGPSDPQGELSQGRSVAERSRVRTICIEAKTIGGFAYKLAVGERGSPQGPKHDHIMQGALNAVEVDADEMVIAYWSKDSISVQAAARKGIDELGRFCAEWSFTREQFEPVAAAERARVDGILALLDEGTLPARRFPDPELPKGHVVTDPTSGQWQVTDADDRIVDTGTWWACNGYCRWQDTCVKTAAGRQPIAEVAVTLGLSDRSAA